MPTAEAPFIPSLRGSLNALTESFTDFKPELREAAQAVADQWDANFQRTRDLLTPLTPMTIGIRRARIAHGVTPVVDEDTPLRFEHDSIREAATDTTGGVFGSAFALSSRDVTLGIDPEGQAEYMRDVLLGNPDKRIPERDAVLIEGLDKAEAAVSAILDRALDLRLQRAALAGN